MKLLAKALEKALDQNQNKELQARLLNTIEKLADGLAAANRQALTPTGRPCRATSEEKRSGFAMAEEALRRALTPQRDAKVLPIKEYTGTISELDLLSGSCQVSLSDDDEDRIPAVISDPVLAIPNNPYVTAFANREALAFRAKALLSLDGKSMKLFISDTVKYSRENQIRNIRA